MSAKPTAAPTYRWLFAALALGGLVADQAAKYAIFAGLYNDGHGGQIVVVPDAFHIVARFDPVVDPYRDRLAPLRTIGGEKQPHVNRGALFGLGQGNNVFFGIVSVAAATFILVWSSRPTAVRDRFLCVALGLILAGTLGNLYDRLIFDGVRDFFHWFRWYDWPVFNVADVCLVIGAGMLLLEAFVRKPVSEVASEAVEAARTAVVSAVKN
jgi:signal peptidase II